MDGKGLCAFIMKPASPQPSWLGCRLIRSFALSHLTLPKRFLVETSGVSLVDRVNQGTSDECQVFAGSAVDPPLSNDLGSCRLQQRAA